MLSLRAEDPKPAEPMTSGPAPGHSVHGEVFDEGPRQAAVLMGNTGNVVWPVQSQVPQVQAFINQGLGQLHGFWFFESERSFRQAAKLDPDCATAYLGMALSNFENQKRARGFMEEATKRKDKVSAHERMYIDAFETFFREEPKPEETKDAKFYAAFDRVSQWSEAKPTQQLDVTSAGDKLTGVVMLPPLPADD